MTEIITVTDKFFTGDIVGEQLFRVLEDPGESTSKCTSFTGLCSVKMHFQIFMLHNFIIND